MWYTLGFAYNQPPGIGRQYVAWGSLLIKSTYAIETTWSQCFVIHIYNIQIHNLIRSEYLHSWPI